MRDESLAFLRKLLTTPSPTGFEVAGQRVWRDYVASFADSVESDAYGNVYATVNPDGDPTVMITGHADEIGFMVNYISDDGFVYYKPIGGHDAALVRGRRVVVHNERGPVRGVTGAPVIHLREGEEGKAPKHHENYVDLGVSSREEAEALVAVGDAMTYLDDFEVLRDDVAVARAFDNRVGTFAAAEALRLVADNRDRLKARVIAVSTVMEEIGGHGAKMASYRVNPDVVLVTDVTVSVDVPGISREKHGTVKLGKGPAITYSAGVHPAVRRRLEQVARDGGIPLQYEAYPNVTGTDLDAIFLTREGIPTALVSVPNRYMHTAVEMIRLRDLEQVAQVMGEFALALEAGERFRISLDG